MTIILLLTIITVGGGVYHGMINGGHVIDTAYGQASVPLVRNETVKLTASDGATRDYFGRSVSVYNNTAVIGAFLDDDNGSGSGSAYVFEKNSTSGNWTQTETVKLTANDGEAGDYFGYSVSVYNNTAVIGAFYDDDDNGPDSGSAYVFEMNSTSGNWTQTETVKLTASDGATGDRFGYSVSVYNNTAVIGAFYDDDNGSNSGSAYVFEMNSTSGNWTQTEPVKLTASDGAADDSFGRSVSVYNNTAVIGAFLDDDNGSNSGSAYVFEMNSTSGNWTQTEPVKLTASDGAVDDYFGYSVSVYDNTAVIGAYGDDDNGSNSGSAYIFEMNSTSGNWTQAEPVKLTASDGAVDDYFGHSVSAYGNTAVIGAYGDDDNGSNSGSAYVFEMNSTSGNWTQTEPVKLTASDGAVDDSFGYSVSVYNNTAVIGAFYDDDNGSGSGSAYIFEKNSTSGNWTQKQKLTASDGAADDSFGRSVSVYNNTAVIGAFLDDINGSDSGSAYVFEMNSTSGNWTQTETVKLTASDGATGDSFGRSVSVYDNTAVIGAFYDDDDGNNSGSAYVFEKNSTSINWTQAEPVKLTASDGAEDDRFGRSVSVYNNTAVIGADEDDDDGNNSGSAYVFEKNSTSINWTQAEPVKLTASDGATNDYFGYSVSVYDNTAVIGADGDDDDGSGSGSAYIFEKNSTSGNWTQTEPVKLTASDGETGDRFGRSVSVYNNTAVIGVYGDDDKTGSAYIFEKNSTSGNWTQTEPVKLTASDGAEDDRFGYSVSVYNNTAVIGAYGDDDKTGSAYVFEKNSTSGNWTQTETVKLTASDGAADDRFGYSVSVYDNTAVIGAYLDDDDNGNNSGSAYVFSVDTTSPTLQSVTISSNNTNSTLAANGDTVTLSFTASESIKDVTATIGNATATVSEGGTSWNATRTLDGTEPEGALSFTINFNDLTGNSGVQVSATTDSSAVTADFTVPTLNSVVILSSNTDSTLAASGDTVTLSFTASESIKDITATIGNATATVSGSGTSWDATRTLDGTEPEGALSFTINFDDLTGNSGVQVSATTDSSAVTADFTAPTPVIATTAADPTNLEIIPFTVDFGENMTSGEFAAAEIMLSSGTVTDFTPDSANQLFAFNATNADNNANLTVDVAASVATDLASNNNTAADQLSITVDRTAPTPVIATTAADPTNLEIIPFTVDFGENMTSGEFVAAEIMLSSGTVTGFATSDDQEFAFNVIEADEGVLTVDVPASVATDLASNNNTAVDQLSITVDRTAPTLNSVVILSSNTNSTLAANGDTVTLSFTASESIADVEVTIANVAATVSGSGTSWDATRTLDGTEPEGALSFTINFDDPAGNSGVQVSATTDSSAVTADFTAPTPVIATTAADPTNLEIIPFTVDFGENMTSGEFAAAEITLSSGTVTGFATSDDQEFAFNVTGADDGEDLTVDVAASVATDLASNNNAAADQLSITVDRTAPTPVIATTAADPTNLESIPFTVDFGESMTPDEFTAAEITLSSGTVTGFATSDDQEFAFNVIEADEGVLTVDVPASVATDLTGSSNAAADQLSITVDRTAPTPVIATTAADPTNLESIPFTVDFGESMTPDEFAAAEITLSSGTVTGFATSDDQEFAFNVTGADDGEDLTVDVPASVATDLTGSSNAAADQLSITVDRTAPTPVIATTAADPTNLESIPFTVNFGESMTPDEFAAAEITLSSGTVTGFATSDDQEFAFNVIEADEGVLTVDVPASVATDLTGSSNAAADQLSITVDRTAPTPVIATTAADPTNLESIPFTVDFGESMTPDEFAAAEITLSSGTVTGFATSDDQEFAFNVTGADDGEDLTVDVPASVATDLTGSSNAAADQLSITVDRTAPTPVIATTAADPTNLESIPFTVNFGESMTPDEFAAAEITLSSGTVTGFATSDDQEFAFNVTGADDGEDLTVDVPASVATDLASNNNAAADQLSITVDRTAPTPVIATTAADPTNLESIPFTVDFGESMTPDEFTAAEITLSSGTVTGFATSDDQEFAFNVIEADEGVLTVDVPASVATDLTGSSNAAADQLSITVDRTAPTPVIATTAADPTNLESIPFTVNFGESMTPDEFAAAEITLSSGTVTGFATSDDQEFAFNVTGADDGEDLTVDVAASVATDLASNNNAAADQLSITVDRTAPTPVIATTAADPTNLESIPFTVDFGESMTPDEFTAAEITLSSGTVTGFATSDDQEFAFNVIEADEGVLTVDVPASVATDLTGSSNAAADQLSITVDRTAPTPVIATTAADPTNLESIPFTVNFGESMTPDEFAAAEITLSSGTVTGFATSDDQEFAFNVTGADDGEDLTVDVPASVATDLTGSSNAAADQLSITVDRTAPTPVIATTAADPTNLESIPFTVNFGESMTPDEFVAAEITLSSGTVTGFATSDDQEFAFNVIEADEGVLTVDVPASVATDLTGSSNAAADQLSITVDRTAPTPVIATTAADPTNLESIPFTVNFGESMTPDEFAAAEITLSSGTVTGFATSDDQEFAFNVTGADDGEDLTVDVPASVATDLASNNNAAADQLSITVDRTAPTPVIATTAADPTNLESIPFTVNFGESMTPDEFTAAEITLSSGTVTGFATSDDQEFAFNVIEADEGVLTVDVPASVATDLTGSSNAAADQLSITVDRTAPTPVIATTAADPTNLESIPFTVNFGESMTPDEFAAAEITLSSGTVTGFATSDDQEFAFNVTGADDGEDLTVDVPASVATDLASNNNAAADQLSITVDRTAPTPVIATTAADPTNLESIPFTVDFGESMTPDEFTAAEITLSSGTVTGFATSDDQEFAFNVIEADEGVLTVDVPASVATDLTGSSNAAADQLSITVDRTAPTPVIATTAADPTNLESIPFTVNFGESMTPDEFAAAEITLSSGTVTGFATSDDQEFAFNVTGADDGEDLTVDVPASVATDLTGSSNAAADQLSITVDRTAPTPVIATTAADPTNLESIPFTVNFGESMTPDEFVAAEITLSSGTVTGFATSDDQEFAFNVIEADEGVLTVDVPASVATDLTGSSNAAADQLSITVDRTAPTPVIATTAADPTNLESIPFTVNFGENMTPDEFAAAEITLSSGTVTGFATSDDQEFAFNVIEADEGVLTVDVPASVATDLTGSSNAAADQLSITVDRTAPTPVIATTAADPTNLESIPFTVNFGESMTPDEFAAAEITLSSGTVTGFATSDDQEFAFNVTGADDGEDLTVDVPASVATDLASNNNAAADQLSITVDRTAPTPVIATTAADPTNLESIPFTVDFGESMTPDEFTAAEITLSSGTVTGFATSDDQEFAFNVTGADDGEDLTVDVAASVATDLASNNNAAADQLSITVDRTAPTPVIATTAADPTNLESIPFTVDFGESMTPDEFTAAEITLSSGTVTGFATSDDQEFAFNVIEADEGVLTVDVPASVATDLTGSSNAAADQLSITVDRTAPTPVIATTAADPTNLESIPFTVNFGESMTPDEFAAAEITLSSGTVTGFATSDDQEFAFNVTGADDGEDLTVDVPASVATDLTGSSNAAADQLSITVDRTAPTPVIATTAADPTNLESIPFTVNFGENMTSGEFAAAEITLSSGTVTGFATSDDQEFAFNVTGADDGEDLTVDVAASVATDLASNNNAAADQLSITVDRTAPTPVIATTAADPTNLESIPFTVDFGESMTPDEFTAAEITLSSGTVTGFATSDDQEFAFNVIEADEGVLTVDVPASVATDLTGSSNAAADQLSITVDRTAPTPVIATTAADPTNLESIPFTVNFGESMTPDEFAAAEITLSSGTVTGFATSDDQEFAFNVTGADDGEDLTVDVAASVATDLASNNNAAADQLSITVDRTAPTPVIATTAADPTNLESIPFTVNFGESMTPDEFAAAEITLSSGTVTGFATSDDQEFAFNVIEADEGVLTVDVPASVATDLTGSSNAAADQLSITVDRTAPTPVIATTAADPTNLESIPFTVNFGESMTPDEFAAAEITLSSGTVTGFATSDDQEFAFNVTGADDGEDLTVDVPASVATDLTGSSNAAADQLSITVDRTAPTPVIATTAADPTNLESIPFTVNFGESMTPDEFVAAEITLSSGTVTGFATSDDQEFAFNVIEADEGVLTVDVPASVATDLTGSSNAAADQLSITVDRTAPTPVIATTAADPTNLESIPFTVNFGESMTPDEFAAAEITLSSGTVTGFATSDDQEFAFNVTGADDGEDLTVDVAASVATDLASNNNAAADQLSITVDRTAPTPVIATTAADPTNLESIPFTVDFGESMTPDEFTAAEITLSSGTVTGFATSDDQEFAFNVIEADEGVLTVDVPASVATDLTGSSNAAADQLSITVDRTAPTPVIATTAADPTNLESIPFTVNFGESMTPDEFAAAEITLSSGTVTGFATSDDQEFAFNVTGADDGEDLTVDVAASVATDLASNNNAAADQLSITVDRTAPTPVIATTAADPTNLESIPFTVNFGESMTPDEFVAAEITLSSGTVTGFATSDDQEFAFNVIEADEGVLTVDVPASVATDLTGSSNAAADQLSITVDRTAPTPVIATTAADPTNLESIPFTVNFGENMTSGEFAAAEITLSSGTVTGFATSDDQEFAFNVTGADDGEDLTVDVAASVATDLASNNNAAADQLSITVDRTAPTPVIATTAADPTNLESIPFTVDFGESMTPDEFTAAEITLSSGTVTGFATSDDQEFAFNVIEADEGVLTVDVPASVATDLTGSSNAAADQLSITVDRTAPTPVIATTAADPTNLESIPFTVNFGESMTPDEFAAAEITLSSGTVTGFATSDDQEFAFNVIEADEGVLTVDVPASVATDLTGSSNAAADQLSITVDRTAPTPVIATTAADPTNLESIPFTVNFGENMTSGEFAAAEITLSSGTVTGFATSDDQEFAFNVTGADDGEDLTVDVAASVATDLASNNNAAADQLSITVDRTAPTPVIATTAADPTNLESIPFTVNFGESMTPDEFTAAEITLSSGTVTGFATSDDQEFAFNVIEADEGVLTVDVPASVATDLTGSSNAAADQLSITVDRTAPTPVIATTAADPTNLESIPFTVNFGENMTSGEFAAAEITLSSGTVTGFATSDDQEFAFNVTGADDGEDLTVDVAASVATDLASNNNAAADQLSITVDRTAPTPVIATTAADPTNLESIPFTVDFGESMTPDEFTAAEITLSSGTVTGFATSDDQEFAFNVIEADEGVLTVDVPASVATDLTGSSNAAADQLSITVDRTAPTPVIATTAADPTNLESIPFTVNFGESMTPDEFVAAEITLSSGTVTGFATSDDQEFAFNVIEADEGVLTVDVPASVATDLTGSSNAAADQLSITVDRTAPTPVIATTAADPTNLESIPFTVNFGENMTSGEFAAAEITLSSGTVTGFATSDDQEFAFNVTGADDGEDLTVDVAASVATDLASNNNAAADQLSITVDRTAPTPVIATTAADPTNLESIPFTVDFGESMTPDEFTAAEITLSSGTVTGFATSDDQEFAFNVIEADEGVLTVDVPASVATDLTGSSNAAADQLSITVDRTAPTPVIATTAADPTNLESIPFTVDFGESMTPDEFAAAEITLSSGTVTGFATSDDQEFAFNVTGADDGEDLTVDVAASVATDLASNNNAAADQLSITVDRTAPTPVIATTAADPTNLESIPFTVDFGESMTPDEFTAAEITLSSGTVTGFATSDDQEFAFNVIEADEGVLTVDVPASVATDLTGSSNAAADQLSITVDRTAPTPVIATTAADPTNLESIPFTVNFGESMTPDEFAAAEITLSSGTVTGFATSDDQEFAFNVIEADEGVLTVDVPASVATDLTGSSNAAADQLSITVDRTAPTPVIATTAADPTNLESIPFTVNFGESMTPDEFAAAEITLSSGTVTGFATSDDQEFAFNVTGADDGEDLTVDVAASVATDLASNNNAAADQLSITVDRTAPTPVIATTAADPTNLESIPFTVDFGESMTPDEFTAAEITLSSGTVTGFATSDDQEFAFNVIEADEGVLTVDVPASVATDLTGSSNAAADQLSITVDRTAPTPVIATTAADPTNLESIPFTVNFGESMTPDEFAAAEITLSSGTVTGFATSDDQEFAFNVIEADEGVLTVDVPASVATDLTGSSNAAADQLSITVDRTAPTPVIATTAADPTNLESIPFTVNFGESMTPDEFVAAEITLSSGTVTGFATSDDQEFAFNVTGADDGEDLTVDVAASVATDLASNNNAAADQLSITVDRTAPTPVIATTAADPTNLESIPFTVDFGESMTPDEFVAAEITLSSGNVIDFTPDSANQLFTFNVTSADDGEDLTVDVPASVATNLAGNNNAAADQLSVTVDRTAPTPVIATTAADPTNLESIPFTVDFGESMTSDEFTAAEITLSSGNVIDFTPDSANQLFTFNVTDAADNANLTVDVPASVATDLTGSSNAAADQLSITVDRTAPTPVIATTAADPTNLESIPFTVNFGESMTPDEFAAAEITLSSGTVTGFATSDDQEFAFNVIEADEGVLTVDVAANVAQDLAGNSNTAADQLSITVDRTAPTLNPVTISSNNANSTLAASGDTVTLSFTASESIADVEVTIANVAATVSGSGTSWDATRTLDGTEPQGALSFTINFDDLTGNSGVQVSATTDSSAVTITVLDTDDALLTFPGSPPGSSGSGGGGGGGGGGRGNTGVSVSGDDSKLLDDVKLYSVSWDCVNGLVRIVAGPDASGLHATVRTTAYGLTEATHASDEMLEGRKVFTSSIQPNESYLGVQLTDISGRTLQIRSESITITECIGEKTFDVYQPESTSAIIEEAAAKAREDTITGQRTIFDSPLHQLKIGIPADQVQCNEGLVLVLKPSMEESACVTESTAPKLVLRGWHDVS